MPADSGKPLIQAKHIVKEFGKMKALNDVSLDIYQGDVVCIIGALVTLTAAIWLGDPENGTYIILRFVSWALMGMHFVLHGILNWKEQRGLAIFDLGVVAFALILVMLAFLR